MKAGERRDQIRDRRISALCMWQRLSDANTGGWCSGAKGVLCRLRRFRGNMIQPPSSVGRQRKDEAKRKVVEGGGRWWKKMVIFGDYPLTLACCYR